MVFKTGAEQIFIKSESFFQTCFIIDYAVSSCKKKNNHLSCADTRQAVESSLSTLFHTDGILDMLIHSLELAKIIRPHVRSA